MASISYPRATIYVLCLKYGPQIKVPAGLNGPRVMAAIAANESSMGQDCDPRHEPSYDVGGHYDEGVQHDMLEKYGRAAACSYGPWQVLPLNAPPFTPVDLLSDPDAGARAFVIFFNAYVIRDHHAQSIEQIGQIYNGGHASAHPLPGVVRYAADLEKAYNQLAGETTDALALA
jgi:hypothetical protein